MDFNQSRSYGVEIEWDDKYIRSDVKRTLLDRFDWSRNDVEECGYGRGSDSKWSLEYDNSCGAEAVSPILSGSNDFAEIREVITAIHDNGGRVNRKCGLHVHHDISDFETKEAKRLLSLYLRFEETLDSMVPNSRRADNNSYLHGWRARGDHNRALNRLKNDVSDIEDIAWYCQPGGSQNRYQKLNFEPYRDQGTVEFRQHSGTLNYEKITNWIKVTQAMVETAKNRQLQIPSQVNESADHWEHFTKALNINGYSDPSETMDQCRQWWTDRRRELAS